MLIGTVGRMELWCIWSSQFKL